MKITQEKVAIGLLLIAYIPSLFSYAAGYSLGELEHAKAINAFFIALLSVILAIYTGILLRISLNTFSLAFAAFHGFAIVALLGTIVSGHIIEAAPTILRLSLYYFSFLAAYFYSASGRDPRTTILGLSIFLLVLTSISSPADYFFGNPPFMNNAVRVSAFFVVHPMAYSFLVFVPLTIYLLMRDEPHTKQSFLLLAAGFAALALTHSRNYTVAFVLIFGWDFVRRATTIPSLVVRIPLIMAPAVLIPLAFPEQFVRVTALLSFDPGSPDSSTDLRFLIWTNALQAFFGSESSTGSDLGTLVTFSLI